MLPSRGYVICATPRTGSTLLCELLRSTGVAGQPESYFRPEDRDRWAERFGLPPTASHEAFVRGAVDAGSTSNGVFGARVMWGPDAGDHLGRLAVVVRRIRFVHLRRGDVVGQAVSWARAEQTGFWHPHDGPGRAAEPVYDGEEIDSFVRTIAEHDEAWRSWFTRNGIDPLELRYEDLVEEPDAEVRRLLEAVGVVDEWDGRLHHRARRQADAVNADWVVRYRSESGPHGTMDYSGGE